MELIECDNCHYRVRFIYPVYIDYIFKANHEDEKWCRKCIQENGSHLEAFVTIGTINYPIKRRRNGNKSTVGK